MKKSKSKCALLQLLGKNKFTYCTLCSKDLKKPNGLISHLIDDHPEGTALCTKCGKAADNEHDQVVHAETHKKKAPRFQCVDCDTVYHIEETYLQHVQAHKEGTDVELEPFLDNSEMRGRSKLLFGFESSNWTLEVFTFASLFLFYLWSRCNTVGPDSGVSIEATTWLQNSPLSMYLWASIAYKQAGSDFN